MAILAIAWGSYAFAQRNSGCGSCDACEPESEKTEQAKSFGDDGFSAPGDESGNPGDEFESAGNEFDSVGEEFETAGDEFAEEFEAENSTFWDDVSRIYWVLGALGMTIVAGILVRFKPSRTARYLILFASLALLGFYIGGCPCMLSSLFDLIRAGFGLIPGREAPDVDWTNYVWFLGLIPITFVFGRVWCGWVCHLGAVQEFLYRKNDIKFLKTKGAQRVMKIIRWALLAALIIQLFVVPENLFCRIDPFLALFNFRAVSITPWILLGLLVVSSLLIYRPFCRAACPVGLALGYAAKIPGASVIGAKKGECVGCQLCAQSCDSDAIIRDGKKSYLDNKDCIVCGECLDSCKSEGLKFYRNSADRKDKAVFERQSDNNPG